MYGSDLLGGMHRHQNEEFRLRAEVQPADRRDPVGHLHGRRTARHAGEIGTLEPGAHADLLVLRGDPLTDIGFLADPSHVMGVVQGGSVVSAQRGSALAA